MSIFINEFDGDCLYPPKLKIMTQQYNNLQKLYTKDCLMNSEYSVFTGHLYNVLYLVL